jgi:cobalt transporter subunit CbtA
MIFSRIVYSAILIGIVTGAVLTCLQIVSLNPIIFAAESYEMEPAPADAAADGHGDHSHDHGHAHDANAWAPEDGFERTAYSFFANVLASTGFAAILLALMSQFWLARGRSISWPQGLLWGLAGYLALFVAPAIGLAPEIPGVVAAPVEHRQLWWALTAVSVSIGLGLFAFSPVKFRALGLLFLVIPYIVGAPQIDGPMFQHADASAVEALTYLHQQFVVISAITNLVFWLLLGIACRFVFNRWFCRIAIPDDYAHA